MCYCVISASAYTSAGSLSLKQNGVFTFVITSGRTDCTLRTQPTLVVGTVCFSSGGGVRVRQDEDRDERATDRDDTLPATRDGCCEDMTGRDDAPSNEGCRYQWVELRPGSRHANMCICKTRHTRQCIARMLAADAQLLQ